MHNNIARTLIIAEAGVNHNGDINLAKELIDCAASAKADIVKFQTFKSDELSTISAPKAEYQKVPGKEEQSQLNMLKKLELSKEAHYELKIYADKKNIEFLSTAFDLPSIEFISSLGLLRMKIPSGELTNFPYLSAIARCNLPLILSTGMADLTEIRSAINVLNEAQQGKNDITLLHCTTAYPTPYEDVNLHAISTLAKEFDLPVGYSDHTDSIEVAIAAVAMGARIIEKHFTLDQNLPGPDHKASLEPDQLSQMVTSIRHIEQALGDGIKKPQTSEIANIVIARKSIVAAKQIKKGEILTEHNITTKRPEQGLSPMQWPNIIGRQAIRDFDVDEPINI